MLKILEALIETQELPQALSQSIQRSKTRRSTSPVHAGGRSNHRGRSFYLDTSLQ